jgi:hypothetical protein
MAKHALIQFFHFILEDEYRGDIMFFGEGDRIDVLKVAHELINPL